MDSGQLLAVLPPVRGKRNLVNKDQSVRDIMAEVLAAHSVYASDYRLIGNMFSGGSVRHVGERLFNFCKKNIRYVVESENFQSTRSPGALLAMGSGDCKHYAGFIGGCLAAMGSIDWAYRFASYDLFNSEPGHVFVVVFDQGREIWIDPVLSGFDIRSPRYLYKRDKKPAMALYRLSGTHPVQTVGAYQSRSVVRQADLKRVGALTAYPSGGTLSQKIMWGFSSGWNYFSKIYGAGLPVSALPCSYLVDGQPFDLPVQAHLLREQGRAYSTRAPQGIQVVYPTIFQGRPVRADMLKPIITPDNKMLIQAGDGTMYDFKNLGNGGTNQILIANNNHLLNMLVAAAGAIQMAYQPYPDSENLQRFYDSMLRLRNMNFLEPRDIKTFAGSVIQGLGNAIEAVGKGYVKFIGIIPRTAFIELCRLNVKGMATHLYANMNTAKGLQIKKLWEGFGGEYNSLQNAARDGSTKKALGQVRYSIGEPITFAAAIASAAPLIALLAQFLKSQGNPELSAMVDTAVAGMNKLLVAAGENPIAVSEAYGGLPVEIKNPGGGIITIPPNKSGNGFITWIESNPLLVAGGGALIVFGSMAAMKKKRA